MERGKEKQVVVEKEDEDVDFGPSPHLLVPVLKRLKRGLRDQGAAAPSPSGSLGFNCFDDDIEEFSSQEDSDQRFVGFFSSFINPFLKKKKKKKEI